MIKKTCNMCSKGFFVKESHVARGWGKYCSRACHHAGMKRGARFQCHICGREVYRTQDRVRKSKSRKYFCGKSCQTKWRNSVFSGEKHKNWKGKYATRYRERLINARRLKQCTLCGIKDRRVLAAHHIDQNRKNNRLENLMSLCHNCHHIVHYDKVVGRDFAEKIRRLARAR